MYIDRIIPKNYGYNCVNSLFKSKCTNCTHANGNPAEQICCRVRTSIHNWFVWSTTVLLVWELTRDPLCQAKRVFLRYKIIHFLNCHAFDYIELLCCNCTLNLSKEVLESQSYKQLFWLLWASQKHQYTCQFQLIPCLNSCARILAFLKSSE